MKPQITSLKIATDEYPVYEIKDTPGGTVYKTEIEGRDFWILESHADKAEKEALSLNVN